MRLSRLSFVLGCLGIGCGHPDDGSEATASSQQAQSFLVSVTPNQDLLEVQGVTVNLSGFPANASVYIGQCSVPATSTQADCGGAYYSAATTAAGTLEASFEARRTFAAYGGRTIDCSTPGSCGVGAVLASNLEQRYVAPIGFRQIPREVTVTPDRDLVDGQRLQVSLGGFPPNARIRVEQCNSGPYLFEFDCGAESYEATTDANGAFAGTLVVRQQFTTPGGLEVLCRGPYPCTVGASTLERPYEHTTVPIRFQELPPTLTIAPATDLVDGSVVHAEAAGFPSFAEVEFLQCRTGTEDCLWLGSSNTDGTGASDPDLHLRSVIEGASENGVRLFQCGGPGACSIRFRLTMNGGEEFWQASAPITFASMSPPRGSARMDLTTPLIPEMTVRLEGSGWAPGRRLRATQCQGPGFDACIGSADDVVTDASGAFRAYRAVWRTGVPDCAPPANGCSLVIADDNDLAGTAIRIPLEFVELEQVGVSSSYEAEWIPLLDQGASVSGTSQAELQRTGAAVLVWLMSASGSSSSTHLPRNGVVTHTSLYTADDYRQWTHRAAQFDYTLDELQKIGGLFYAWLLAGRPPLP
ncbi:MAG TPA: neocarzinostatin apoprotein domain-containing protein [Polyangiaceae bacterium]